MNIFYLFNFILLKKLEINENSIWTDETLVNDFIYCSNKYTKFIIVYELS